MQTFISLLMIAFIVNQHASAQAKHKSSKTSLKTSYNLEAIKTPKGNIIKFKKNDTSFFIQWFRDKKLETLYDYPFSLTGADAWFPKVKEENNNYIFLEAGCGNPCRIGIFLPLYSNGQAKVINEYQVYDLVHDYVAYFNKADKLEVLNLKTLKKQSFLTGKCKSSFKGYCVDTMYFKNKTLIYRWNSDTFINSENGKAEHLKLSI